jgi:dTMP kinase
MVATQGIKPNVTFLLDISPEIGLKRKRPGANDRFEQEALDFHRKVREGFLHLASHETGRWVVIDSTLPRNVISDLIWQRISAELGKRI